MTQKNKMRERREIKINKVVSVYIMEKQTLSHFTLLAFYNQITHFPILFFQIITRL